MIICESGPCCHIVDLKRQNRLKVGANKPKLKVKSSQYQMMMSGKAILKSHAQEACTNWFAQETCTCWVRVAQVFLVCTPCLKKTVPTYILLLVCQIWTDFNKNWRDCPRISPYNDPTMPTSPKICACTTLGIGHWETWSVRLSHWRNDKVYIWVINWIATNMTGRYCLSVSQKCHTCHITSSLLHCVLKMSAFSTNAST